MVQVKLIWRNNVAKQARGTAEEPVQVISTEQGPEVEVGFLLCRSSDGRGSSSFSLGDRALRDKKHSSICSRSESVHPSSGLG